MTRAVAINTPANNSLNANEMTIKRPHRKSAGNDEENRPQAVISNNIWMAPELA
jgi:hypothetical protein